nr:MAG TPA: hypothetical protein [Crassvirales sp.]
MSNEPACPCFQKSVLKNCIFHLGIIATVDS